MADAEIRAVITAQDNASGVVQGFTGSIGDMAKGVALGELAAKGLELALEEVKNVIEDSIKEAAFAQDTFAILGNAVENMGAKAGVTTQELVNNAMALENHSKFSHVAVEGTEAFLTRLGDLSGPTIKNATQAIVDIASSGKDMESTTKAMGRALEDPTKGIGMLARAGVILSEQEKKNIKDLADHGNLLGAQTALLKDVENRYHGLGEEMAKTGSGPITMFMNKMKDLAEAIGNPILNAINPWIQKLADFVGSEGFRKWLDDVGAGIQKFAVYAGQLLKPAIDALVAIFKDVVIPIFEQHRKQIEQLGFVLGVVLVSAIGATIVIIAAIIGAIAEFINIILSVQGWIDHFERSLVGAFGNMLGAISKTISNLWDAASGGFNHFLNNAINWANNLINTIVSIFQGLPGRIGSIIGNIGSNALGDIKGALHSAHIPGFATGVTNFSGGLALVGESGPEIVQLPRGSNVVPNSQFTQVAPQSPTINLSVNVGVYAGTEIEKRKLAQDLWSSLQDIAAAKNMSVTDLMGAR